LAEQLLLIENGRLEASKMLLKIAGTKSPLGGVRNDPKIRILT